MSIILLLNQSSAGLGNILSLSTEDKLINHNIDFFSQAKDSF